MLKIHMRSLRAFFLYGFFLLILKTLPVFGEEVLSMGPLFNLDRNKTQQSEEINALGPFITSKRDENSSEFGFRPFFYLVEDRERDLTEFDFLYPLATYDRREEDLRFQLLIYLLSFESYLKPSGFREKEFTLFPFVFAKGAEEKEKSYFALFPVYGKIKDKFLRDEINFFLFPLFLQTKKGEASNYSVLWPFFGYYTGDGQEGFRLWPLFGYRKKEGVLDEKFALWPIYLSRQINFHGEEIKFFSIFPLYSGFESPERTQDTYLWPLFNRLVDKRKGIERWDAPWPFINFTRGKKEENRVFPFYANEIDGEDEEGFFLWPLYRYYNTTLEDHKRTRKTLFLFLYSDIKEEQIVEGGRNGRRIDLWPLFSYKRDSDGNRSFHFLSILEPFLSTNEGIERNYSSFWRLFEWKKDKEGRTVSSLLWNTFRKETDKERTEVDIRPIIPIFSYRNWDGGSKVYFFGGLFGYKTDSHQKILKFLFIPINISSENGLDEKGGEKR